MAIQPTQETRLSQIIDTTNLWLSILAILIFAALCITSVTIYAFQLSVSPTIHTVITDTWYVANTLGAILLAMTIYGWVQVILRRRKNSRAASIVGGARTIAKGLASATKGLDSSTTAHTHNTTPASATGQAQPAATGQAQSATTVQIASRAHVGTGAGGTVASAVSRTILLVASSVLVVTAVAPQSALDIYNQPPPTHAVPLRAFIAEAQGTPLAIPTAATGATLPVMQSNFLSTGRRCADVATDISWSLVNTATTQAGQQAPTPVNWTAFVGDTRFTVTPDSGQLAPSQKVIIHVRGPAIAAGAKLFLSLYVTDATLDYTDIGNTVTCG